MSTVSDLITSYEHEKITLIQLKSKLGSELAVTPENFNISDRATIVRILMNWSEVNEA